MIDALFTQPLTIEKIGDGPPDDYGVPTRTVVTTVDLLGYLEQHKSSEYQDDRDTITADWRCHLPAGTDIAHTDRVVDAAGNSYEVIDAPWQVWNPRTASVHHIQVLLRFTGG